MFEFIRIINKLCVWLFFLILVDVSIVFASEFQPDAGIITKTQQVHKTMSSEQANIKITIAEEPSNSLQHAQNDKITVKSVHVTGQDIYSDDHLENLVKNTLGGELTLSDMESLADRITAYLHSQGYIVSTAYIPVQEIKDGVLEIRILIGKYGEIEIRNHSKLSEDIIKRLIRNVKTGDYVKNGVLERTLLLLDDAGDVSCLSTLLPGKLPGTTNLIIEITDIYLKAGQIALDNYGNPYTGKNRLHFDYKIKNINGNGDSASVGATTGGKGINDVNFGYSSLVGPEGIKLGLNYYQMHYSLGKEFSSLKASGQARILSLNAEYPIVRSRNYNLYSYLGSNYKELRDIHTSQSALERTNQINEWNIGLRGSGKDEICGGGINSFDISLNYGHVSTNDSTTTTPGSYKKTVLNFSRLQYVNDRLNLLLGFSGQVAGGNLVSSEKFFLGGANGVKAYSQGQEYGDQGYLLTGELRWNLPTPAFQLAFFMECGGVNERKSRLDDGYTHTLSGAGVALICNRQDYSVRMDYAWPIHSSIATANQEKEGRFWLQGVKYF